MSLSCKRRHTAMNKEAASVGVVTEMVPDDHMGKLERPGEDRAAPLGTSTLLQY